ncbi:MAG: 50S ribosomal protein L18 [Fidelibacterota bacterium]
MKDKNIIKRQARLRKRKHIKKKISGTAERPRLVVYRSLKHIYAQIINDEGGRTIVASSSLKPGLKDQIRGASTKTEVSHLVGKDIGKIAVSKGIKRIVFDRNGYLYHGRVKALADGARTSGLEF